MSNEYNLLKNQPRALEKCTKCGHPFHEFMRGLVQCWWRRVLGMRYCAVICRSCKNIVGWERP